MDIQKYIDSILNDGIIGFKVLLNKDTCKSLYKKIQNKRPISKSIFFQEDESENKSDYLDNTFKQIKLSKILK